MSNCDSCPSKGTCKSKDKGDRSLCFAPNAHSHIKNVVAVMSGKGGVGKSTIAALLTKSLKAEGYRVGIMDADITGPSVPRLMNVPRGQIESSDFGMLPVLSPEGIPVISLNYFLDAEERPVLWRGPMLTGAIKQFWEDVYWGELDYLVIDMPPGTGDMAITVMQSLPLDGIVMVTTPHGMVNMIVAKAVAMAQQLNARVLGVVNNMSSVICPDCGKKIRMFDDSALTDYLTRSGIPLAAEFPMTSELAGMTEGRAITDAEVASSARVLAEFVVSRLNETEGSVK